MLISHKITLAEKLHVLLGKFLQSKYFDLYEVTVERDGTLWSDTGPAPSVTFITYYSINRSVHPYLQSWETLLYQNYKLPLYKYSGDTVLLDWQEGKCALMHENITSQKGKSSIYFNFSRFYCMLYQLHLPEVMQGI